MERLTDSAQMKKFDNYTMEHYKVPSMVLMERAALGVVEEVEKSGADLSRCLIVCGLGNNGGDGLAVARMLYLKGHSVDVVIRWEEEKASEETRQQYMIISRYGLSTYKEIPDREYALVVDALFGIGLTRPLEGRYRRLVDEMNGLSGFKVAIDIPSGIRADDGQRLGSAFTADLTVTFGFQKIGLVLFPGSSYAGLVVVKDIGIYEYGLKEENNAVFSLCPGDLSLIPARRPRSNKGSYGRILVVAGKKNMAGAAYLSAKAAAVTGCGLVKLFTAEENRVILQSLIPEAVLETYTQQDMENGSMQERLAESAESADAIVVGPGLGTDEEAKSKLVCVLKVAKVPVIIDADGLNLISEHAKLRELLKCAKAPVIITPHLGEMSRLAHKNIEEIQRTLLETAREFAREYGLICILKDARTICALPCGRDYINQSGNNGMSTAGAGDVLTGILAGLLAQNSKPEEAAPLGVYIHGMAGDAMVQETGIYGLLASDIITGIKYIMRKDK